MLVESVIITEEELCVTEKTVETGSKRKRVEETVLVLAPDSKRQVEAAGLEKFAVQ